MADHADVSYSFANSDVDPLFVSIKTGWRLKYDRWASSVLYVNCSITSAIPLRQYGNLIFLLRSVITFQWRKNQPLWTVPECCPQCKMAALIHTVFCFHSLFRIINDLWMIEKLVLYVSFLEPLFMRQKMKNQYEIQLSLYSTQRDVTDWTKFKTKVLIRDVKFHIFFSGQKWALINTSFIYSPTRSYVASLYSGILQAH